MAANGKAAVCLLAGLMVSNVGLGQEEQSKRAEASVPQPRFYRLEFVVKELEHDKVINARMYSTSLSSNTREGASIRAGSRVPYAASTLNPGPGSASTKQYQYYDIGVNIDSRDARELAAGQLALYLSVDVSSLLATKESGGDFPPAVRNTKWSSPVVVPIKKSVIVFSSDDPSGNRKMQLELTAIPIT
jgi:hypothetical protein